MEEIEVNKNESDIKIRGGKVIPLEKGIRPLDILKRKKPYAGLGVSHNEVSLELEKLYTEAARAILGDN